MHQGLEDVPALLLGGGDDGTHSGEVVGTPLGAEATGDLLAQLGHLEVTFGLIVRKRRALSELLEAIEGNDREIWIVADERRVDAVLALPDTDFSKDGKVPVTCLFGDYRGKPRQCDLAPLRGRRCLLIADTDSRDRNAVLATARALAKLDCGIRLCLPDGEDETVSHIGSAGCAEEDKTARGFQRPRFGENLHGTCAQRDPVFLLCLHPLSRNCPGACISVDFVPSREPDFARARGCQNQELERQFDSHNVTTPQRVPNVGINPLVTLPIRAMVTNDR